MDENKKCQAASSLKLALDELDALISLDENDAKSLFLRGRVRKLQLLLSLPCADYDDKVLEFLADMVAAVQLAPQNDEFVAGLAKEKLEYTLELEHHCTSVGESVNGDSMIAQSLALSWQHTLEIARSALAIKDIRMENRKKALYAFCYALYGAKHFRDCTVSLKTLLEVCEGDNVAMADALDLKGQLDESNGDIETALQDWSLALQQEPNHLNSLIHKATALRAVGKSEEAIEMWTKLNQLYSTNADFPYRAAADLEICGQHAQAIESLEKCLKLNPKHLFALNDLAFHHIGSGNWKEAMPLLQEVLSQGPDDDIPWINMANVLFHLHDYEQALRSINNALTAKRVGNRPPSAEEWLIKIAILRALSRQPETASSNEASSSSSPSAQQAAEPSSSSSSNASKPSKTNYHDEITKCFNNALKAQDKMELAQANFEYADYLVELGQVDNAKAKLAIALKTKPSATAEELNLTRIDLQPATVSMLNEMRSK